jgi:hypothetical protein
VPYAKATVPDVLFTMVTLQPTGFTELSLNDLGLKTGSRTGST